MATDNKRLIVHLSDADRTALSPSNSPDIGGGQSETNLGTLYGIGVGPGDPELLTLKAVRLLKKVQRVVVPASRPDGGSQALDTVRDCLTPGQTIEVVQYSMSPQLEKRKASRREVAQRVLAALENGEDVAFISEGDALMHSTFQYLLEEMPPQLTVEVVPGVNSVSASAAAACYPLVRGDETLLVLPASAVLAADFEERLQHNDTLALLKVSPRLDQIIERLETCGCLSGAVLVERASLPGQRIHRHVAALKGVKVHYMSLLLIRGRGGRGGNHED